MLRVFFRFRPFFLAPLLFSSAVFAAVLTGCNRETYNPQGALSIPPDGSVRVLSKKIAQTPDRLEWKWTIIGERNWVTAKATETRVSLAQTYPANTPTRHDGTNIWEVDFIAERKSGTLNWTTRIHGINNTIYEGQGTAPLAADAGDNAVQIEIDRDSLERLPANLLLARVGERTVTLRIDK